MDQIIKELEIIFKNAFPEMNEFNILINKKDSDFWDSMGHLNLIVELEDKYELSLSQAEIENIKSVKDIIQKLKTN